MRVWAIAQDDDDTCPLLTYIDQKAHTIDWGRRKMVFKNGCQLLVSLSTVSYIYVPTIVVERYQRF